MNTERTEKFVNAIACDLEEGGFRQVSGTTLRRSLTEAVASALPLLEAGNPVSELAEQQGVHDALAATLGDLAVRGMIDDVPARMIGEAARKDMAAALAATGKQQVGAPLAAPGGGEWSKGWNACREAMLRGDVACGTCNGWGLIGGPSFSAPDEGGVPCPDCSSREQVGEVQGDALCTELLEHADSLESMAAVDRETGESIEQAIEDGEGYTPDEPQDIAAGLQYDADRAEETSALLRKAAAALAARQPGAPRAWLIHWSKIPLESPEVTTSASRVDAVSALTDPPRIEPLYAAPPAQGIDLGPVRSALQAAEGLCACCAAIDGYSRNELHAFGLNMRQQFRDALALIKGRDATPGVGS